MFRVEDDKIYWNNSLVFTAIGTIDRHVVYDDRLIFLFDIDDRQEVLNLPPEVISRNLFCIDKTGKIIWQAPLLKSPYINRTPYTGLTAHAGEIKTYNFNGYQYTINPDTGQLFDPKFLR